MERRLCVLVIALLSFAAWGGDSPQLAKCAEDFDDCKENCSIDYGTSFKLRAQLGKCMKKCGKKNNSCRSRTLELEQANIEIPEPPKKKQEETVEVTPAAAEEKEAAPVAMKKEEPPVRTEEKKVEKEEREEPPPPKVEKKAAKDDEAPPPPKKVEKKRAAEEKEEKEERKPLDEWDDGVIER